MFFIHEESVDLVTQEDADQLLGRNIMLICLHSAPKEYKLSAVSY